MTSRTLKRLGFAAAALVAVAIGAFSLVPLLLPVELAHEAVAKEIEAVTGIAPVIRGPVTVEFPSATVNLADVLVGTDTENRPALSASRLTAHLRLLPLLRGAIEISSVTLEQPRISVVIDADGHSNWTPLLDALRHALAPGAGDRPRASFSEIRINRGAIEFEDRQLGLHEAVSDVTTSLAWPSISRSFGATGHFAWRDQLIDAGVSLGSFPAALAGQPSNVKLRLSSAPLKLALDGTFSTQPAGRLDGTLAVDGPSLRDALTWVGSIMPSDGDAAAPGRFAVKGQINVINGTAALIGANVELDGNAAEGVMTYAINDRHIIQATLAADKLDLTPYMPVIQPLTSSRNWDQHSIRFDEANALDVDLRLSAASVTIGTIRLGRSALAASLRGDRLTVTVGETQAFGGVAKGTFTLAKSEAGAEVRSQMQFVDVELDKCLNELLGLRRIEGKGDISLDLEGSGGSIAGLTRALTGTASLTGGPGALVGVNVEQLLRRLERRPLSGGGDYRNGRTPYDTIKLAAKIDKGIATIDAMRVDGALVRLGLDGTFSIPTREFDMKGTASLVSNSSDSAFDLPFVVQGAWDDPILLPDPQILIRRSGAAAPLLEALKDRRARETVRSALDQLTGAAHQPPPPEAPKEAPKEAPTAAVETPKATETPDAQ